MLLFYSYSHKDEKLRMRLETHLALLKREGVISEWHDRKIGAGAEWAEQISSHLRTAQIILLLVTADFLASDYCFDVEMKFAMERHESGAARVIPVLLRPSEWEHTPLADLSVLPLNAVPVVLWRNQESALYEIAKSIRDVVKNFGVTGSKIDGHRSIRILLADDEQIISDTLTMILNQSGFRAFGALDGEESVEVAAHQKPSFFISDVIMGGLNGIDAAIRIREILPDCRILLFSGQAATADLMEKARAKGYDFEILAKPVHPADLLAKLRSAN